MATQILAESRVEGLDMRDDDQKPPVDNTADARPARKPWTPPRLVPLDVSSTDQIDDTVTTVS
jgi:hypothetical protein